MTSIFFDQYDIEFNPEGFVKDIVDAASYFNKTFDPMVQETRNIIDKIDLKLTCQDVYSSLGVGAGVSLVVSLIPGASHVAQVGTRSTYYLVRAGRSLTNLAQRLRKASRTIWKVSMTVMKLNVFVA